MDFCGLPVEVRHGRGLVKGGDGLVVVALALELTHSHTAKSLGGQGQTLS
jgi:hypothetical protein